MQESFSVSWSSGVADLPSLHRQVVQQRYRLVARQQEIQYRAGRVHAHLSHPLVVVSAFICGALVVRAAPGFHALHELAGALIRVNRELGKLNTTVLAGCHLTGFFTLVDSRARPGSAPTRVTAP